MSEKRPNPDSLLERIDALDSSRGRLKIYIGMAAGSGKTFAMLSDALVEKKRGTDVLAGYIEPHGRIETEQLAEGLERIPLKEVIHKGIRITEFDLETALKRKPTILLIDELAHTNAPGSRHAKRWQDVEECLSQGINVHSTLNVQHIESLSDVVQRITGIEIQELVPDHVIKNANEIELIDITPEELIQRIREGKVYLREKAESALSNFFKPGNLMALREIVLRLTAERVDEQLRTFRRQQEVREVWPAHPRVLVCVSPHLLSETVVRTASRLARALQTELVAVSIDRSLNHQATDESRTAEPALELAERLGARIIRQHSDDVVGSILRNASDQNANIVVVGKPIRSRLRDYLYGSVVDELIRQSGPLDVYVITDRARDSFIPLLLKPTSVSRFGIMKSLCLVAVTTALCFGLNQFLDISNLVMFYLLSVSWAAARWGRTEAVLTSVIGVLAFNFFFVPPRWTFEVANVQYLITFAVMLTIGLLISTLTARVRNQAEAAAKRERRTAALYELTKHLAQLRDISQLGRTVCRKTISIFGTESALWLRQPDGALECLNETDSKFEKEPNELAVAEWVATNSVAAGAGTMTLAGAKALYVPLGSSSVASGVLGIITRNKPFDSDHRLILDALITQVSSTMERILAEQDATQQQVEAEKERIRSLLLSSVSHDFRTPLTTISGAADTLLSGTVRSPREDTELIVSIKTQAEGLSRMVRNVLDLTKLESGQLSLRLEWESLEEIIGTAIRDTRPVLADRSVIVSLSSDLPLLKVDATLMVQVFVNLFENVARHAPNATEIRITGTRTGDAVTISFEDNGPGLPLGSETKVFEKSFRGNQSTEGFGLGLTICSAIMRAHQGSIVVDSRTTIGTRFVLTLPVPSEPPEVKDGN